MFLRPTALLPLLLLPACGEDPTQPTLEGTWTGTCSGEFELDLRLDLDVAGAGPATTTGELELEQQAQASLSDHSFELELEPVKVGEHPDKEHGGTISTYNRLSLEGTLDAGSIAGTCWIYEYNSDAEDDSSWWYEATLELLRAPY